MYGDWRVNEVLIGIESFTITHIIDGKRANDRGDGTGEITINIVLLNEIKQVDH